MPQTHVIVGAGQAGGRAAEAMRTHGFSSRIVLVGEEPHLPYERPPLSKQVLLGDYEPERTHLNPAEFYDEQRIELRLTPISSQSSRSIKRPPGLNRDSAIAVRRRSTTCWRTGAASTETRSCVAVKVYL